MNLTADQGRSALSLLLPVCPTRSSIRSSCCTRAAASPRAACLTFLRRSLSSPFSPFSPSSSCLSPSTIYPSAFPTSACVPASSLSFSSTSVGRLSISCARPRPSLQGCSKQRPPPPTRVRLAVSAASSSTPSPGGATAAAGAASSSSLAAAALAAGPGAAAKHWVRRLCLRLPAAAGSRTPAGAAASCQLQTRVEQGQRAQQQHPCDDSYDQQQQQQPAQQHLQQNRRKDWVPVPQQQRGLLHLQAQQLPSPLRHCSTRSRSLCCGQRRVSTSDTSSRSSYGSPDPRVSPTPTKRGRMSRAVTPIERARRIEDNSSRDDHGFPRCSTLHGWYFPRVFYIGRDSERHGSCPSAGSSSGNLNNTCRGRASISSTGGSPTITAPSSLPRPAGRGGGHVVPSRSVASRHVSLLYRERRSAARVGATAAPRTGIARLKQQRSLCGVAPWSPSSGAAAATAAHAAIAGRLLAATRAFPAAHAGIRQAAAGVATHAAAATPAAPAAAAARAAAERRYILRALSKKLGLRSWTLKLPFSHAATGSSDKHDTPFLRRLLLRLREQIIKPREKEDVCLLLISFSWLLLLSGIPLFSAWKRSSRERRHPYLAEAHRLIEKNEEIQRVFGSPLLLQNKSDTTDSTARFKRAEVKVEGPKASGMVFVSATAGGEAGGEEDIQQKLSYAEMAALLREQPYLLKFLLVEKLRLLAAALWTVMRGGVYGAAAGSSSRSHSLDASSSSSNEVEEATASSASTSSSSSGGCRGWRIDSVFAVVDQEKEQQQGRHQRQQHLVVKHQDNRNCTEDKAALPQDDRSGCQCTREESSHVNREDSGGGRSNARSSENNGEAKSEGHPHLILIKGNPYNNPDFLPQLRPEGGERLQRSHPIGWLMLSLLTAGLLRRIILEVFQARERILAYAYLRHFVSTHPHLQRLLWRAEMKRRLLREREAQTPGSTYLSPSFSLTAGPSVYATAASSSAFRSVDDAAVMSSMRGTSTCAAAAADGSVAVDVEFFTGIMRHQHIKGVASLSYCCRPAEGAASSCPPEAYAAAQNHTVARPEAYEFVAELEIEASRTSASAPFRAITSKLSLIEESDTAAGDPPFPLVKSYFLNPHVVAPFRPRVFSWKGRDRENNTTACAAAAPEADLLGCARVRGRRRGTSSNVILGRS